MRKALVLGVALMLQWTSGAGGGQSPRAPVSTSGELTSDQGRALAFRTKLGLPNDLETVRLASTGESYSAVEFGVSLSPEEHEELYRRGRFVLGMSKAAEYAATRASFAGLYYDQRHSGRAVFLFTEPPPGIQQELAERSSREGEFIIAPAEHTIR
ncbi:MAG: hypothetical protein ACSLFN_16310 [Candidatus Limnocylindrales bacterium]